MHVWAENSDCTVASTAGLRGRSEVRRQGSELDVFIPSGIIQIEVLCLKTNKTKQGLKFTKSVGTVTVRSLH